MSCPERTNNTISFTVKNNATGTVIVRFRGDLRKRADLHWGNGGGTTSWDSCSLDSGVCYSTKFNNATGSDCNATVKGYFTQGPCSTAGPAADPANAGEVLVENCNPGSQYENHVVVGSWLLLAPDESDTVEITIIVEDNTWLGEGDPSELPE